MFVIANARKLMGAMRTGWARITGKHARFLPTVQRRPVPVALSAKKYACWEQPAIRNLLPLSLAKGVRSPLPLRLAGGEQWQIVNVTPGTRRFWRKRLVAQSPLAVTSPLSVLRAGDVFERIPWFGVWILHGNYSDSLLFDTVPLTDPLMTAQSLASGHLHLPRWR